MFNLIKRGVKSMAKTVNNMISNNNEVELAKIKLTEGCVNAIVNTIKDPQVRKVVGVIIVGVGVGLGGGLIASSYV